MGKKAIIVQALYGLKSAGAIFGNHIADCMCLLGYEPCRAEPDLWFKAQVRPDDGFEYYEYVLIYVDDRLAISHDAMAALYRMDKLFMMNKGYIGDPDIYLGAKMRKVQMDNGVFAWGMIPAKYVQEAVRNVEEHLTKEYGGRKLPKRATAPWPSNYVSETDMTPELGPKEGNYYQCQIGILQWMVEIGRVDIITEVLTLASQMAMPREGHMDTVFHVFAYLNARHNSRMVFDPTYPSTDKTNFQENEWKRLYRDVKEEIQINCTNHLGREVDLRMFVDSDHATDGTTRRSSTGYFIYVNLALVNWLSKKQ